MLVLGIETSGRSGSVALLADGQCVATRDLETHGRRHAQTLVAETKSLFDDNGFRLADCEAVAVSIGPGSFTGLRVGVVCAKTLAYATKCRLAAVDTFEIVAAESPDDVKSLYVISDAQRGEIFVGQYIAGLSNAFQRFGPIGIHDSESWFRSRRPGDVISGPDVDRFASMVPPECRTLPPDCRIPTAETTARLGWKQILLGVIADPWKLEPFYLRKSAAEEKWEGTFDGGDGGGRL